MELLQLSKFKLQLRALIIEARELREREGLATEQVHHLSQKQKQSEEEFSRKLQELQAELASSHESRLNLENKVKQLESHNLLLDNKQKELKGTIDSLLQSREAFLSHYEDSTCEMKRSIQIRDRKIAVISEKIQAHLLLFDSIEKEAVSIKQLVDNVQQVVSDKEDIVAGLKKKMDEVSAFGKELFEKFYFLENKLRSNQYELRRKEKVLFELHGQLEAVKISDNSQQQIQELQKALSLKEEVIQNMITEKKALQFEAWSFESILRKIQDAAMSMNVEDQKKFSLVLKNQEEGATVSVKEDDRSCAVDLKSKEVSPQEDTVQEPVGSKGMVLHLEKNSAKSPSNEMLNPCVSEFVCSPKQSAGPNPQSVTTNQDVVFNKNTGKPTVLVQQHLDSESSTTEEEALKGPEGHV